MRALCDYYHVRVMGDDHGTVLKALNYSGGISMEAPADREHWEDLAKKTLPVLKEVFRNVSILPRQAAGDSSAVRRGMRLSDHNAPKERGCRSSALRGPGSRQGFRD